MKQLSANQTKSLFFYIKLNHLVIIAAADEQEINSAREIYGIERNTVFTGVQIFVHHFTNGSAAYISKRNVHYVGFSDVELNSRGSVHGRMVLVQVKKL